MKNLHWWTLLAGAAIGYFILPPVIGAVRSRVG